MWSAARRLPAPLTPPVAPSVPARPVIPVRGRVAHVWRGVPPTLIRWATVAMCVVALAEAAIIARLLLARSTAPATVDAKAAIPPPLVEILPIEPPPQATPIVVTTATVDPALPEIRAVVPPAAPVRTGAFRVSAPIELHVLDGERVVGSSVDGPIVAPGRRGSVRQQRDRVSRASDGGRQGGTSHPARRPGAKRH